MHLTNNFLKDRATTKRLDQATHFASGYIAGCIAGTFSALIQHKPKPNSYKAWSSLLQLARTEGVKSAVRHSSARSAAIGGIFSLIFYSIPFSHKNSK